MKEHTLKKKVGKKLAIRAQDDLAKKKETKEEKETPAGIKFELALSNLRPAHEIAERFIKRYNDLIDQGYFADLQEEFKQVMRNGAGETVLAVKLTIDRHDYLGSETVMPIKWALLLFDKSEMKVCRDNSFITTYMVGDEFIDANCEVCPSCKHRWSHKIFNYDCPGCEIEMGDDVKYVIENDSCPHCRHPGLSESDMVCKKCGHEVYDETVCQTLVLKS